MKIITKEEYIDFSKLNENYISFLDVTKNTKRAYKKSIKRFIDYLKINYIFFPNQKDAIKYRNYLLNKSGPATTRRDIIVLKAFFNDLAIRRIYDPIFKYVKNVTVVSSFKRQALSLDESKKLLAYAKEKSHTLSGFRNYAIIQLMLTTGLRSSEVVNANISDISSLNNRHILYVLGKKRYAKHEYVVLANDTFNLIVNYLVKRDNYTKPLFLTHSRSFKNTRITTKTIRNIVTEYFKSIGIDDPRYTAHSLRHTFATNLIKHAKLSTQEIAQILRHKDISTTEIYNQAISRDENNGEVIMNFLLKGDNY